MFRNFFLAKIILIKLQQFSIHFAPVILLLKYIQNKEVYVREAKLFELLKNMRPTIESVKKSEKEQQKRKKKEKGYSIRTYIMGNGYKIRGHCEIFSDTLIRCCSQLANITKTPIPSLMNFPNPLP